MTDQRKVSNQVIIHELMKDLKNRGYDNLTARPYNYCKQDHTTWWLVSSTEWPSFKYGKFVLQEKGEGHRTGLYLEKGISERAAGSMD